MADPTMADRATDEPSGTRLARRLAGLSEDRRALLALRLREASGTGGAAPRPTAGMLAACVVAREGRQPAAQELRRWLAGRLPAHMVPGRFVVLESLPRGPGGKLDQQALLEASRLEASRHSAASSAPTVPAGAATEEAVAAVWREVLGIESVGLDESFFDLGGHSFLLITVQRHLEQLLDRELAVVDLFRFPTVRTLAAFLDGRPATAPALDRAPEPSAVPAPTAAPGADPETARIAIVGMAGRFPGARSVERFWHNLVEGVESITFFSDQELLAEGWDPKLLLLPECVKARGVLEGAEDFDAEHFGFSRRDAEITDPQQRLFLETAYRALEDAGHPPERCRGRVGVFAGASKNTYAQQLGLDPELRRAVGDLQIAIGNERDYLATRVSYKLGLEGPSMTVQTACSTSLAAVHVALQSLLRGECELALAGGVAFGVPVKRALLKVPGDIVSPDGHCRAFDARAAGTVGGQGVGVVALKRLDAAERDGDQIYAVIRGSAINNDGAGKVGFTAPGVDGQAKVIAEALAAGGVAPETVGYVEAHGTGTELGDPIEVAALHQAFAGVTERGSCALGSVKTNIGHLDAAAGVAGLIKAALAVRHGVVPPSLHFERPNPEIDFARGPFYVQAELGPWPRPDRPRRAGVSSFGIGGTNVHLVLEEPPARAPSGEDRLHQLLVLSGRTAARLERAARRLADHLEQHPETELADTAYTLQVGRSAFFLRRTVVAADREQAMRRLRSRKRPVSAGDRPPVAFLFPGQGVQQVGMGSGLYRSEPVYRQQLDRLAELFEPHLGLDLRRLLDPPPAEREAAARRLAETRYGQAALFAVELALARLWMAWGVTPAALLGHSLGEYVAACVAGTFSVEDAVALVAARGEMMQALPAGAMLAVSSSAEDLEPLLGRELALATLNGPDRSVVSGPPAAVAELERRLADRQVPARRLAAERAFHSSMVEPIVEPFAERVSRLALREPAIPWISNVTGRWISPREAIDPSYWARHLRSPVRFADGLDALFDQRRPVVLEVGPGRTLAALVRRHPAGRQAAGVVSSLAGSSGPARNGGEGEPEAVLAALGELWAAGGEVRWESFHAGRPRRRVTLPPTPFERRRHWLASSPAAPEAAQPDAAQPAAAQLGVELLGDSAAAGTGKNASPASTYELLAEIWSDVLGNPDLGPDDDFYALGGDSLLAIRVVALARQHGLSLGHQQMAEHSRLGELAAVLGAGTPTSEAPTSGTPASRTSASESPASELAVPLAPSQEPFFDGYRAGDYWNQAFFFELRRPLRHEILEAALGALLRHHDALGTRFVRRGEAWRQVCERQGRESSPPTPLIRVDLRAIPSNRRLRAMTEVASSLQPRFDLSRALLVRFVDFDLGPEDGRRLFFLAPHVLVDAIALEILIEDLERACEQLERGLPIRLPPKTTAFSTWSERLADHARSPETETEAEHWLGLPWSRTAALPLDHPGADNARGSVESLTLRWGRRETRALTQEIPVALAVSVEAVLLAGVVHALAEWTGRTAQVVALLGHGRPPLFDDLDVSRTVGYFTVRYPLALELEGDDPVTRVRGIAAQLKRVPGGGLGYGVLRHAGSEPRVRERMADLPAAEVRWNYLSRNPGDGADGGRLLRFSGDDPGPVVPSSYRRRVLLDLVGVIDGDSLRFKWSFSRNCHDRSTIERLAGHFEAFLASLLSTFPSNAASPGAPPARSADWGG